MSAALNLKNLLKSCEVSGSNVGNHRLNPQSVDYNSTNTATTTTTTTGESGGSSSTNKKDENEDVWSCLEAQAAFLGATPASLWDNGELKVDFMDMEEFFIENGLSINASGRDEPSPPNGLDTPKREAALTAGTSSNFARASSSSSTSSSCSGGHFYVKPNSLQLDNYSKSSAPSPQERNDDQEDSDDSCGSFADSIRPTTPRPGPTPLVSRRKRAAIDASVSVSSSINGNTSDDGSYVPGMDFDPKNRPFSQEELRPQPMSKKSKKQYVPEDLKDDKYWVRRRKNNMAAKRSRDARRVKENQIAMRAAFLENENAVLKAELDKVNKLYAAALKRLEQYEKPTHKK